MAARQIVIPGAMPSRDQNGRALPAKFRFYVPGATLSTPKTVYTDASLSVAHPFPILSDSAGRWPQMWADDAQSFDVGWTDQVFDETIRVFTGVSPANDAVLASAAISDGAATVASAAASSAAASAASAAASALAAAATAAGLKVKATSSTTNTIGTGTKVFTLDQGVTDFAMGMDVQASDQSNTANRMVGTIQSVAGNVLTMLVPAGGASGSGPHSAWSISLTAIGGVMSVAGLTGIITATAAKTALAIASTDLVDFAAYTAARDGKGAAAFAIALGA